MGPPIWSTTKSPKNSPIISGKPSQNQPFGGCITNFDGPCTPQTFWAILTPSLVSTVGSFQDDYCWHWWFQVGELYLSDIVRLLLYTLMQEAGRSVGTGKVLGAPEWCGMRMEALWSEKRGICRVDGISGSLWWELELSELPTEICKVWTMLNASGTWRDSQQPCDSQTKYHSLNAPVLVNPQACATPKVVQNARLRHHDARYKKPQRFAERIVHAHWFLGWHGKVFGDTANDPVE